MLIDFHTHAFPTPLAGRVVYNFAKIRPIPSPTPENLFAHEKLAGVDRMVNLPVAFRPDTASHVNDFAFQPPTSPWPPSTRIVPTCWNSWRS